MDDQRLGDIKFGRDMESVPKSLDDALVFLDSDVWDRELKTAFVKKVLPRPLEKAREFLNRAPPYRESSEVNETVTYVIQAIAQIEEAQRPYSQ